MKYGKRRQGQSDSPLTPRGIALARAYGRHLRETIEDLSQVTIETSPLGRARHTATLIGRNLSAQNNTGYVDTVADNI